MPALREPVVVNQLRIRTFGPAPRSLIEFVRENAHGNRDGDAFGAEIAALAPEFPVETGARNRRVREPGDRDVVENVVTRETLRLSIENASDELQTARIVVEEIRSQADGRIGDAVQRLRSQAHLVPVADSLLVDELHALVSDLLIGRETRWRRR